MRTELRTPHVTVRPGQPVVIELEVANTADVIDGITAIVGGLSPSWVTMPTPVLSLFPEATGTFPLRVTLPRDTIAGEYLVTVQMVSTIDPSRSSAHDLWLTVEPVEAATLRLRPSVVVAGRKASFDAIIANEGNVVSQFGVAAVDETRIADCKSDPVAIGVAPGQQGVVKIRARGPRPWFAQAVTRTIQVTASSPNVELATVATFTQKPRIPRGLLTIAILFGIVALWATIFLLVIERLRDDAAPAKAVASHFNADGVTHVPLTAVAGSVTGTVTAASNGEGLERITVEGYRVLPDGTSELAGSAATADDGTYTLGALVPGTYKLRFTADGHDEIWYPAATSEAAAGPIEVPPLEPVPDLGVVLDGEPGSIVGAIEAPDSASGVSATVTITQIVEQEPPATEAAAAGASVDAAAPPPTEPVPVVVQSTGPFRVDGLITPGKYRIVVESAGFDPVDIEATLEGGETGVINTIRLGAADGSLAGAVRSADGTPLGNVTVVVRSGELEQETTTPTAGNVGAFILQDLPTPRTYVLTFTLDGFSSQTIALELLAGQDLGGIEAVLVGGTGTIAGTTTDAAGTALGGVKIMVARGDFTAETATLTTAGDVAGIGGFTLADIPTPGTYTVTFSLPGFLDETRIVRFPAPGAQAGVDATMRRSQATITGTATDGVTPLPGVSVELTDGRTSRTTSTASSPIGTYSFSDVEPGTYTISYQIPGYRTQVVIVQTLAGDAVIRDVALARTG